MFIALITLHTQLEQNHNHEQKKGHKTAKNTCEWKFVRRKIFALQFHFIAGKREKEDTCDVITNRMSFSMLKCLFLVQQKMLVTIPGDCKMIVSMRVSETSWKFMRFKTEKVLVQRS